MKRSLTNISIGFVIVFKIYSSARFSHDAFKQLAHIIRVMRLSLWNKIGMIDFFFFDESRKCKFEN